jgi:uncharacterized protein YqfA (UPF0365 family)
MSHFATAQELATKLKLNISPEEIEADLIEGRNVLNIIFAIVYALKEGIAIDYHTAIKFDRIPNSDVPSRIKWSVDPQIFHVDPIPIVTKDGTEVKLKVNATVRGKFMLFTQANRDEIFTTRIKEGLIKEVERYHTYNSLVESLNLIAWKLFLRFNAKMSPTDFPETEENEINKLNEIETRQNSISAYEILDINIPSLEIDNHTLNIIRKDEAEFEKMIDQTHAEKRKSTAKALELEAKAKLIDSEAELNLGMAEAFRKGEFSMKDHLKKKIFDNDDDSFYTKSDDED